MKDSASVNARSIFAQYNDYDFAGKADHILARAIEIRKEN